MLGKAREVADSLGDRVTALVGSDSTDPQQLIHLGADEVLKALVETPGDWIPIISDLIETEKRLRALIFPSNIISNVISGAIYYREMRNVGGFLDEADFVDGTNVSKGFDTNSQAFQKALAEDKVNILSINILAAAPPFEDTARYGKVKEYHRRDNAAVNFLMEGAPEEPVNSCQELTVVAGDESILEATRKLAERFHSRLMKYSGLIEVIYGPCIAVEVSGKLRLLPEFGGDLISLNSRVSPINAISDVVVVNSELNDILDNIK